MRHHFRRFCFVLAQKLGMTVAEVMTMESSELTEWMGFCLTQNETWMTRYKNEMELERQANLSPEEMAAEFKMRLGGA